MKKIININLSGRVIPIEDSAYESLQRYIDSLRRYFANEEGRDEIINDIESRIAELMNEKIRKNNAPVSDEDMEEIIASMGRIEDFEQADAADTSSSFDSSAGAGAGTYQQKRFKGRLYRDANDKLLGGVCSGIANYVNMDPAVVRLLFAIITFGGFGLGFLLYILLWIILPIRPMEGFVGKRLFRNPDDRIIGGVCGGLAAYFNKSSKTIRLIFAAPLIINIFFNLVNGIFSIWRFDYSPVDIAFGSITSTFILAYIVLWIVLPEARSPFEKMEMRGEKVDVNRIRQNVQEGMNDFKSRAQSWGEEVKDSAQRLGAQAQTFAETRGRSFAAEARPVASGIGHAIGVLFKAFFLFVAGSIAFGLFVGLMILVFGGGTVLWPIKQAILEFVLDGFWQNAFFWGTVFFFIIVPIIAFITWLLRRIMRVRTRNRYLGWTFAGLWVIGLVSFIGLVTSLARDFRAGESVVQNVAMAQPTNDRLMVQVSEPEVHYSGELMFIEADDNGWNFTDDSLELGNVKVSVEESPDSNYHASVIRRSQGMTNNQAYNLARRIRYNLTSRDSILDLGSGFGISRKDKYRGQEVEVMIMVPVGKKINFDRTISEKLTPFQIRVRRERRRGSWEYNEYFFGYRTNVDYVMTPDRGLVAVDEQFRDDENRYNNERQEGIGLPDTVKITGDRDSFLLEEQKRRIREEADEKIRQLEERRRRTGSIPKRNQETTLMNSNPFLFSIFI